MSISSMNGLNSPLFATRTFKQGNSNNADPTAGGQPEAELLAGTAQEPSTRTVFDGAGADRQSAPRDANDKIIASWFRLMKPHDGRHSSFAEHDRKQDDPGRVPDPLYEPTKEHVPDSLHIITFNDLMRALAPKKPHWKHYDDVSNQFQVGSHERD